MIINNITRLLDAKKITYQSFDLPVEKLGAEETAKILGVPAGKVFKSIILKREKNGKPIIAVIPGDREVNLKLAAEVVGEKKVLLTSQAEAERLTGLQTGGISPLALINQMFTVLIDESVLAWGQIHISGGQRGLNILLGTDDFLRLTNARLAHMTNANSIL